MDGALFEYLLRLGDNALVLGHRTSEWCGLAPVLEEDIALANIALDLIGQARMWLDCAGSVEDAGRCSDDLAFHRHAWDFRNLLMLERPNGDFGHAILRQFLFDAFHVPQLTALAACTDQRVADIAAKCVKEARYHPERSSETVVALGDGTDESHAQMQAALDTLWPYTGEMFAQDPVDTTFAASSNIPEAPALRADWECTVTRTLSLAQLSRPDGTFAQAGGKTGRQHSEHLGPMLAVMQVLPRSQPDAQW